MKEALKDIVNNYLVPLIIAAIILGAIYYNRETFEGYEIFLAFLFPALAITSIVLYEVISYFKNKK